MQGRVEMLLAIAAGVEGNEDSSRGEEFVEATGEREGRSCPKRAGQERAAQWTWRLNVHAR